MKKILIDVPNRKRDIFCLTLLKMYLEKKGHDVKLVDGLKDNFFQLFTYLPDVIVLGQVAEIHGAFLARYAKTLGISVIVLRTEGGCITKNTLVSLCSPRYTKSFDKAIDLEFVWGPKFADIFIEESKIKSEKVKVCGSPRFDIYSKPFSTLILSKKDFIKKYKLDYKKKIVVYASNLAIASLDLKNIKNHKDYLEDYENYWVKIHKRETELREITTRNVFEAAKEFEGKATFVLKLHPTEDFRYYLDYLKKKKLNNIVFIKDEPIFNVLNASDLLIHTNTTAATEAWFLGKPTISMVFIKKYKPYFGDQIECSEIVSDYMQLHDKLDYYLEGGKLPNNLKVKIDRFITDWYYKIDGKSTERCVNFIDKFLQQNNTKTRRKINFEVIDMVVKNDLMDYIKSIIYSNKTLRHTFLKIKWKKTKKELDIIDAEYAVSFEDESKNIEEKCKNLLS